MNQGTAESNFCEGGESADRSGERASRDADILALMWKAFRVHGKEIDSLLDLSLCILASTSNFPEKANLEVSLKRALYLSRNSF